MTDSIRIHLVGAGPGDPNLLTVKAARLLAAAEVVVHDRLVSNAILDLVPRSATRVFVGKTAGRHVVPQARINDLLVELARSGRRVVRLKGGDPFVFGRGSEEALHLARHGIDFEVVPGITAASGCAAAARIPLTHRGLASGVRFVTGHCREDGPLELDWDGLADLATTLVIYMGLANLPQICVELCAAGLPDSTPVAAVSEATTPQQRVCVGTLGDIVGRVARSDLRAPVLFIVGSVVGLAEMLGGAAGPAREFEHARAVAS